ncbi:MAG: lactate racemase domain-containing protein [Holdemanella sp.]|uniref:lactate racemase domain-containing protein n=1 Tax=Holdemanella sp. TaxID=1971762 RepID=UPI00258B4F14|nr:lactate racemase domain-containing protein [Holdemanella sp.]MCI7165968.1 lactate racemase domain-containing protein [Holdemanella sp.]
MFKMNVPYDKGQMKIKLKDKNLAGVLEERQSDYKTTLSENEIVEQSLNNPIGSKSLEELAKGKKNIVIISSDHTRPVPSKNYYTYSFKKNS